MSNHTSDRKYLDAAKRIFTHLADTADANISIRLWDGSFIPLGDNASEQWNISIKRPGVLGAILRKPTLENFLRQYASGNTRRAKQNKRQFARITPGRRFILKYIFPGSELDHIGHTLSQMEACGFEVHDVEAWREHYAQTTKLWCRRLESNKEEAIALVGKERYRMWIAYLAGVSYAFLDGSLRIFQTVATKHGRKGPSTMPSTREHLYLEGA